MTFENGELTLRVGKKNLIISPAFGHSQDGIAVLVEEDRILFAGDSFMPLPYVVDGNVDESMASIKQIGRMGLENIVQGHGDIILRGEIDAAVKENLNYLATIKKSVRAISKRKNAEELLDEITIERLREEPCLSGWPGANSAREEFAFPALQHELGQRAKLKAKAVTCAGNCFFQPAIKLESFQRLLRFGPGCLSCS